MNSLPLARIAGYGLGILIVAAWQSSALSQQSINPTDAGVSSESLLLVPGTLDGAPPAADGIQTLMPVTPYSSPSTTNRSAPDNQFLGDAAAKPPQFNRFRIRPVFRTDVVYDDNIFISHNDRVGDILFTITGGLAFELGDYRDLKGNYLLAEYDLSGLIYADHSAENAINQNAVIRAQYLWGKLGAKLESHFQDLTGSDRDVGNLTTRKVFDNSLKFIYDYSEKVELDSEFQQLTNLYKSYLDSYEYIGKFGGNYLITGKTTLGLEGRIGELDAEGSPSQTYEQARVRARYEITGKLTLDGSVGIDFREFGSGGPGTKVTPVFTLGAEYRPFPNTVVSLKAYRNILASASIDAQDYIATGVQASLKQMILQRFSLAFTTGYEDDKYEANVVGTTTNRVDDYFFLRPSISYVANKWLTVGLFYQFSRNASSDQANSFYDNQVGLNVSLQF